jgi:sugar lactone lactonase YvrE
MKSHMSTRIFHRILHIAILGVSIAANAAQLDLVADAVVGKATLTSPTGGTTTAANMLGAIQIAEDPVTGALWVSDQVAHRVLRFSSAAAFVNGEAANLVLGQADFTSSSANRGGLPAANTLLNPIGVAVDQAGRVYVGDDNNRVLVYRPPLANGMDATWVIGQADFTSSGANRGGAPAGNTLSGPRGLALDRTGNLYVVDISNNRVLKFDAPAITGASASKVFGQAGFTTATSATTATGLNAPVGIAIDGADNLWVADLGNNRILRYDGGAAAGDNTADLVLCQSGFTTGTAGTAANACSGTNGVAVDREGVVYVNDYSNSRVLRFTPPLSIGMSATAVIGQANFTSGSCNQGTAGSPTAATLCTPFHPLVDRSGNLLVADRGNSRVLRYDLPRARVVPSVASLSPESVPQGSGTFTLTVNGSGFYGGSVVNWNGSPRTTQYISDKRVLAQISAGDVASSGPFSVTVTNPTPGGGTSTLINFTPYTRAPLDATADRVLGQPNFTSAVSNNPQVGEEQLGTRNAASFNTGALLGVAVDKVSGRLFVADTFNGHRILSWPSVSSFYNAQPADVMLGQPDEFTAGCNTGGVSASSLCIPYGLAVDSAGALYVSDRSNNRILRYVPPFATGMAASGIFGQGGSFTTGTANNGGISANSLSAPRGLAVDNGALFVHDSGNRRVLVYNNPNGDFTADAVIGQADMTSAVSSAASSTRFGGGDSGLALDSSGRLYLAIGIGDSRVLRFTPPFTNGMAADLVIGQADFSSTALATTATGLVSPVGVALDPGGNLLVADYNNNRVMRYAAPLSSAMAATGVLGQTDFVTGSGGTSATKMSFPIGLAFDRVGNLIVTDYNNARVVAFDRPFSFILDPAADLDGDGIPNGVEITEGRDPYTKDNDIFSAGAPSPRLFAMQQYRDFLSREGDPAGITGWTNFITAGTYSRLQVINAFLLSDEFAGVIAPVVRLYFATFLRIPDYAGLTFNAGLVRNGTVTITQLADFFTASPEFTATYGSLNNTQFVTLLYNNVLNRAPDPAGLSGWVSLLNSGYTRGQVLLGFSDSVEYQASQGNKVFVTMMYAGMLRRTPEPTGFNGWVAFLDTAALTREQVINGFFASTEYHNRFLP